MGFNFTKLDLERKSGALKDIKINTDIDVLEITEAKSDFIKSSDQLIAVGFKYNINYEKDIASLKFLGNLIVSVDSKTAKEILKQWKDKKLPDDFRLNVFNIILKKSSLKAIQFEEELNLPSHIPLPSFRPAEKKK